MIRTDHFRRCIATLQASTDLLRKSGKGSMEYEVYRNAVIKGFELVLETSGKLLRKHLKEVFARPAEADELYFKDVFRHAAKHGLLDPNAVLRWFGYRDSRNITAHDYGEALAEDALQQVSDLIEDAAALAKRLEGRND